MDEDPLFSRKGILMLRGHLGKHQHLLPRGPLAVLGLPHGRLTIPKSGMSPTGAGLPPLRKGREAPLRREEKEARGGAAEGHEHPQRGER